MVDFLINAFVALLALALLYKASTWVVKYSIIIAKILGVSTFVVGFILVSVSTSLPELGVAFFSSLHGEPSLSAGNVLGANLTAVTLILGLCAIFGGTIHLKRKETLELIELLFISVLVMFLLFFSDELTYVHGIILLGIFALLIKRMYGGGQVSKELFKEEKVSKRNSILRFCGAVILLIVAAELLVNSVLGMMDTLNVSSTFIGATFVALGTTIPELSFELTAIRQKRYAIAMGDLFGSAVTNVTLIFGSLVILNTGQISIFPAFIVMPFMLLAVLLIWYGFSVKKKITKGMGVILLIIYALYLVMQGFAYLSKTVF